ncbi:MAG: hypothetical protein ACTHL3_00370 [Candidatus Nitrosocosmicus sp.]
MEKGKKVNTLISITIVIVTILITLSFSKGAYDKQCIKKSNDIPNNFYQILGRKDVFSKSFNQTTLSISEQKKLHYFENIINQCPDLKNKLKR